MSQYSDVLLNKIANAMNRIADSLVSMNKINAERNVVLAHMDKSLYETDPVVFSRDYLIEAKENANEKE